MKGDYALVVLGFGIRIETIIVIVTIWIALLNLANAISPRLKTMLKCTIFYKKVNKVRSNKTNKR